MSLLPGNWLSDRQLAVLFVRDMGNYEQNRLNPATVLVQLRSNTAGVRFTGYHWRPSGNFLFICDSDRTLRAAQAVGEKVIKLPCLVRTATEVEACVQAMPHECEETVQWSVILKAPEGIRKIIWVGLPVPIAEHERTVGRISARCSIHSWTSPTDVLCFYDRPKQGGDVGQVTTALVRAIRRGSDLLATGRSMGLIRALTIGKGVIDGPPRQ